MVVLEEEADEGLLSTRRATMKVTVVDDIAKVLHVQSWEVQSGGLFKTTCVDCQDCPWSTSDITSGLGVG